jgi:hypothetical protein
MIFGAPHMLWGLLGLIIPVAIHLLSRKEQRVIRVGSVRLFRDTESVKVRRILPTDILLLLLRCLLIVSLVFWLAEPKRLISEDTVPVAYLIDPGLAKHPYVSGEIIPLQTSFWLQRDTPPAQEDPADIGENDNYWELAANVSTSVQADSIVFITRPLLSGMGEFRPLLSTPFSWVTLDSSDPFPYSVGSFSRHDSAFQLVVDEWTLTYNYDPQNTETSEKRVKKIAFMYPDSLETKVGLYRKLLVVLGNYSGTTMEFLSKESNENADFVFWFHQKPSLNLTAGDILVLPDQDQPIRLEEGMAGSFVIRGSTIDAGYSAFAEQLMKTLGLYPTTSMDVSDPRFVSNEQIQPRYSSSAGMQRDSYRLFNLLLVLAGVLLLTERFLSMKLKR